MIVVLLCSLAVKGVYGVSKTVAFPAVGSTLPLRNALLSAVLTLFRVLSTSFSDTGRSGRMTAEVSEEMIRDGENCG